MARMLRLSLLAVIGAACAPDAASDPMREPGTGFVGCTEPRPEVCTRDYRPVCAQRDTGIRCVTTPCDSAEWVTRSNACTACSEAEVMGYRPRACAADAR